MPSLKNVKDCLTKKLATIKSEFFNVKTKLLAKDITLYLSPLSCVFQKWCSPLTHHHLHL